MGAPQFLARVVFCASCTAGAAIILSAWKAEQANARQSIGLFGLAVAVIFLLSALTAAVE